MTAQTKDKKSLIPADLDISLLDYLEYGDVVRVAKEVNRHPNYVSRVKNGDSFSVKVLAALLKKGLENKKQLTQH